MPLAWRVHCWKFYCIKLIVHLMYVIPLQTSLNATLTMVGVPRLVTTPLALSCAAVEVDSSLQAMDWTVMVWHCYQRMERGGNQ